MNNIYRKHLCGMFSILATYSGVLILCLAIIDIFLMYSIKPLHMEANSLEDMDYQIVIESNTCVNEYLPIRKLDNIITFSSNKGAMNINTYISGTSPYFDKLNLSETEIVISEKMAQRLHLSEGDSITADYSIYDQPVEYKVKSVVPFMSDLYNVRSNRDFSYAIIGYDSNLAEKASGKFVYLMSDKQYDEWMNQELSYIAHYNITEEKETIKEYLVILYAVYFLLIAAIVLIINIFLRKAVNEEILKYYYEGYSVDIVKKYDRMDIFIFMGIPVVLQIVFVLIGYSFCELFCLSVIVLLAVLLLISVLQGGMRYAKVHKN